MGRGLQASDVHSAAVARIYSNTDNNTFISIKLYFFQCFDSATICIIEICFTAHGTKQSRLSQPRAYANLLIKVEWP